MKKKKLADWLYARPEMSPRDMQVLLGIKFRSTLYRYMSGERRPRKMMMQRINRLTNGQVTEASFDGTPPRCAMVILHEDGTTSVVLPWSSRDRRLDTAYRHGIAEPKEGDDLTDQATRALLVLGGRAKYLGHDKFMLDGRPSDLLRIVRAANENLAMLGLPLIDYPVAHPKQRSARTERHSWGLFGFLKRKSDDNDE